MMTKVIFRKFKCGEVIALFPQEPATRDGSINDIRLYEN